MNLDLGLLCLSFRDIFDYDIMNADDRLMRRRFWLVVVAFMVAINTLQCKLVMTY